MIHTVSKYESNFRFLITSTEMSFLKCFAVKRKNYFRAMFIHCCLFFVVCMAHLIRIKLFELEVGRGRGRFINDL